VIDIQLLNVILNDQQFAVMYFSPYD